MTVATGVFARALALDGDFVYWIAADGFTVGRVPLAGGGPTTVGLSPGPALVRLRAVGGTVYASDAYVVYRVPGSGGALVPLPMDAEESPQFAVDATQVVWPAHGGFRALPHGAETATFRAISGLDAAFTALDLVVDGEHVYFLGIRSG